MTTDPRGDWHACWSEALDGLEIELERAEELLASGHVPAGESASWRPPSLPPIPPDLVERARIVHARQLELAARMTRRLGDMKRQQSLVDRMETRTPSRPLPGRPGLLTPWSCSTSS